MKFAKLMIVLTVGAISACASKPQSTAPTEAESGTPVSTSTTTTSTASNQTTTTETSTNSTVAASMLPHEDPNNPLCQDRSVYFDLDSTSVKEKYQPLLSNHAQYLGKNAQQKITLQGHTDDRGSREYNLALGQRRAEAVKRAMSALGASETQINTISFGEERPEETGQNESAWAQNRRVDIQYAGEE